MNDVKGESNTQQNEMEKNIRKESSKKLNFTQSETIEENTGWNENRIENSITQLENSDECLTGRMDKVEDRMSRLEGNIDKSDHSR